MCGNFSVFFSEFDDNQEAEKLYYLCRKLTELQKSNAAFKDCVIDFINLLQRGYGIVNIAHFYNVHKVDFSYPNAQYQCFQFTEALDSVFDGNERKDFNFDPSLFSFIDKNAHFV